MNEQERLENIEQALYQSSQHFRALRSVAFILSQTEGKGPFEWSGPPMEDLTALIDVLAQRGVELSNEGLEEMTGIRVDRLRSA